MAKKMYNSPLFLTGLTDEGNHTEPYTNSQDIYTPDKPGDLYPDFMGLSDEQMAYVLGLSKEQAWALDGNKDGVITADEVPTITPPTPDPE